MTDVIHDGKTRGISPKAVLAAAFPAVAGLLAAVIQGAATGEFDRAELVTAAGAIATSVLAAIGAAIGATGTVEDR